MKRSLAALLVAVGLLVPGCGTTAPGEISTECNGVTLTPGPCDEPFSTGPEPIVPEGDYCPTPAEVEAIHHQIPIVVAADATAGTLACRAADGSVDLTPAVAAMVRGLMFMKRVRFDAPLPFTPKPLYDWVRDSIPNGIRLTASGNSHACVNCAGPIFINWQPGPRSPGAEVIGAVSIITHETRHTNGLPHTCRNVSGLGNTSDKTIAELGAFGADYYVREWIATHSDEHPDTRENMRKSVRRFRRSFCCECPQQPGPTLAGRSLRDFFFPLPGTRSSACGA